MFFSFDGIDGVGKSTQVRLFVEWLDARGEQATTCRDPGSTKLGEEIRGLLLNHDSARVDMVAEMLLYMAARAQLVSEVIQPALKKGETVVCDRYLLANLAYQAYAGKLSVEQVKTVGQVAIQGRSPDATFLLDIDPDLVKDRLQEHDRMEARGIDFQKRVREGFLKEAELESGTIHVISAADSIESIAEQIQAIALPMLESRRSDSRSGQAS